LCATVCDPGEPVLYCLFVEAVRIVVAEAILGVRVIRVLGMAPVSSWLSKPGIPPQSSGGAACSPARFGGAGFGQG
jgi:hypothetical protein